MSPWKQPPDFPAHFAVRFAALAAVAITNAENKAKLTASRARVVATADETRRQLQRDVHDGAQQRMVQTVIILKLARAAAARREPTPVKLTFSAPRLPAGIETTAYFIVAEALANVVKHAAADRASVRIDIEAQFLIVEVSDDGAGGANATRGSGLTGLQDRVDAAGGTLTIASDRE